MKRISPLALLLFTANAFSLTAGASESPLRYSELPEKLRQGNSHWEAVRMDLSSAESRTGHLGRSFLPRIQAEGGGEAFSVHHQRRAMSQPFGSLVASVNALNGGRDYLENLGRNADRDAAIAKEREIATRELLQTRQTYLRLMNLKAEIRLLEKAVQENDTNEAAARSRIQAGLATQTDLLEFKMYRSQLDQDLAQARVDARSEERDLLALLGMSPESSLEIESDLPHMHAAEKKEVPPHWSLLALQAEEAKADALHWAASAWWAPSLDLYAGAGVHTLREFETADLHQWNERYVGARVTLTLFDGWVGRSEKNAEQKRSQARRLELAQTRRELDAQVSRARWQIQVTHDLLESAEAAVQVGNEYLEKTLGEYRRGVKNSPDVLGACQKALELRRRAVNLKRDHLMAEADLRSLQGEGSQVL
jgi:outer membrane protein TolC